MDGWIDETTHMKDETQSLKQYEKSLFLRAKEEKNEMKPTQKIE